MQYCDWPCERLGALSHEQRRQVASLEGSRTRPSHLAASAAQHVLSLESRGTAYMVGIPP